MFVADKIAAFVESVKNMVNAVISAYNRLPTPDISLIGGGGGRFVAEFLLPLKDENLLLQRAELVAQEGELIGGGVGSAERERAEEEKRQQREARVAVRIHAVDHPAFASDVEIVASEAGHRLCHVMVPKVESVDDVLRVERALAAVGAAHLPVHALIESPAAVHCVFEIAEHPRVQSLSFGLMDFVSAHGGAIPAHGMSSTGQFSHPLVVRAKLEIAAACHAHGKVPSHCVVTEFSDAEAVRAAAGRAAGEMGFTRMWSIHPAQIRPILQAFAPRQDDIVDASEIIAAAIDADWAPINHHGTLHDRASYRFYWQVLERAHQTARPLPQSVRHWFRSETTTVHS
jgi:citrate lyase subunit beta/citryl-CoA lyase